MTRFGTPLALALTALLWATAFQVASMLKLNVVLLLPDGDTVVTQAAYPPEDSLDAADLAAPHAELPGASIRTRL